MAAVITHRPETGCFEALIDGQRCEASYRLDGNTMVLHHTGVPRALEGRGIAAALVAAALAHARSQGLRVRPVCSYVQVYMRRHPDTLDLLAGG
jgi:predicted GNAT family acetyltransferase